MAKSNFHIRLPMPLWFLAAIAVVLTLSWLLQYAWLPEGLRVSSVQANVTAVTEIAPLTGVRTDEIMTSNRSAWAGIDGRYPDWVELTNTSANPVDITGWKLTDRAERGEMFAFPEARLAPGERVLIYLTGALENTPGRDYQAPFRLSAAGDSLMLFDAGGAVMESLNIPPLGRNEVYARDAQSGQWAVTGAYTPGLANTDENHRQLTEHGGSSDSPIVISKLMADNRATLKDADGDFRDWIELSNTGSAPVDLAGYCLSDDPARPERYRLPDVTLAPGARLVVFASGKDKVAPNGEIHLNFSLNPEGETVTLTDAQGGRICAVSYSLLKADQTYARQADGSYAVT